MLDVYSFIILIFVESIDDHSGGMLVFCNIVSDVYCILELQMSVNDIKRL